MATFIAQQPDTWERRTHGGGCYTDREPAVAAQEPQRRPAIIHMENIDEQVPDGLWNLDPQVIGAIYDKYFTEVYRYVRYRLNDEHVAEDITSDVFVRLLEGIQNRQGPQSHLRGWLLATASHIVADHLRRSYRRPTEALSENVLDQTSLPSDEFDRREETRWFQAAYARTHSRTTTRAGTALWRRIFVGTDGVRAEKESQRGESPPVPGAGCASAEYRGGTL